MVGSLDSGGSGRAWGDGEPERHFEEALSPIASRAVWGKQGLGYMEFSRGRLCWAALPLKCSPKDPDCF